MNEITIVTVEDHHLTREGIKSQIESDPRLKVVAEGSTGGEVIHLVEKYHPDILLLDLDMPQHKDGSNKARFSANPVIKLLCKTFPETKIIIISMNVVETIVSGVFRRGARGYLLKDDFLTMSLPHAIHSVHAGGIFLSDSLRKMVSAADDRHTDKVVTKRQKQIILELIKNPELNYDEIGERLHITEGTVKNRMSELYSRLKVTNKTSAIIECIKQGIIVIDGDKVY